MIHIYGFINLEIYPHFKMDIGKPDCTQNEEYGDFSREKPPTNTEDIYL
jgi:hypothetical protein